MNIALMLIIVGCFGLLYFLVREKIEIITFGFNQNDKRGQQIKFGLHRNLLNRYLKSQSKINLKIYQSLTGLTLEQAVTELEAFASEGWLKKIGVAGEVVYADFRQNAYQQNIKDTINRG